MIGIQWWAGDNSVPEWAPEFPDRVNCIDPHCRPVDASGSNDFMLWGTGLTTPAATVWGNALTRMSGALDAVMHVWYPPPPITAYGVDFPGVLYDVCPLIGAFLEHRTKHLAGLHLDVKRTLYVSGWLGYSQGDPDRATGFSYSTSQAAAYGAQIAGWMAEPGWLKYKGRPVLCVIMDGEMTNLGVAGHEAFTACWAAFVAALTPGYYLIALGVATQAALTAAGAHSHAAYGPNGTNTGGGVGQKSYVEQALVNINTPIATGGREYSYSVTIAGDQRARNEDMDGSLTRWTDTPTVAQVIGHLGQGDLGAGGVISGIAKLDHPIVVYALTEFEEGGPAALWGNTDRPTAMLDAFRLARQVPARRPNSYVDLVNANTLLFTRGGSSIWSRTETGNNGIVGALEGDLRWLVAATDTLTATFYYCTRIRCFGPRGSVSWSGGGPVSCGQHTFTIDGGSATVVDANSGSGQKQLLFDSGVLSEGAHTLVWAGHAANSGASRRAGADYVEITFNPQSVPAWLR